MSASQKAALHSTLAGEQAGKGCISIKGARLHNLRNVSLDLPKNQLIVFSGPSGCGKSSLVFSTLHAEGRRQFLETLSSSARQFLKQLSRPDVDEISGLPPTIAVEQLKSSRNPRSTVGTLTEIFDFLRVLYARVGIPHCLTCGVGVRPQTPEEILFKLESLPEGVKVMLLSPWGRGRLGDHLETFEEIRKAGLLRIRVNGQIMDLQEAPDLDPEGVHQIEAVVDRLIIRPGVRPRMAESLALALRHGHGGIILLYQTSGMPADSWHEEYLSTRGGCTLCGASYPELEPRNFSFNGPHGACPTCSGLGRQERFTEEGLVQFPSHSLANGAVPLLAGMSASLRKKFQLHVEKTLKDSGISADIAWLILPENLRAELLKHDSAGLYVLLEKEFATTTDEDRLEELQSARQESDCLTCQGARLNAGARNVFIQGKSLPDLAAMELADAAAFLASITWSSVEIPVAHPLLAEILRRIEYLRNVGLHYLTLDRNADSLSGGEFQRTRLASTLASGLVDVCYVLDEPTVGLHPVDGAKLVETLQKLKMQGNTLLVVEHDEAVIRSADLLVDMGPGAGKYGGEVLAATRPNELASLATLTGQYLSGAKHIQRGGVPRELSLNNSITLRGCNGRNLRAIDVSLPLGALICVAGPSGSGKSTLISETLAPLVKAQLHGVKPKDIACVSWQGLEAIERLVTVDQRPLGRSQRGNLATLTGIFEDLRKIFAATKEAKARGFNAAKFSFNTPGGRCETCKGQGFQRISLTFLPDLEATCPQCRGRRYSDGILQVRFKGHSIADVLDLSVDDALALFQHFDAIARVLHCLQKVGLGYLKLGQSSDQLSGGEAQRLKLANELSAPDLRGAAAPRPRATSNESDSPSVNRLGKTLYLLDEPTTGLHFEDVQRLLNVLDDLVNSGHTVVIIEHHLDMAANADWVIELGPGGGKDGGELIYSGSPSGLMTCERSVTAPWLRRKA